jgi:hypothetical protein
MTRIICLGICALTALAQSAAPQERASKPQFEVATLKANKSGSPASWAPAAKSDQFSARNDSLRDPGGLRTTATMSTPGCLPGLQRIRLPICFGLSSRNVKHRPPQ